LFVLLIPPAEIRAISTGLPGNALVESYEMANLESVSIAVGQFQ
jgi:hypothetical protein